jgi:L-cysteine S-thiosulfotransferase
MRAIATVLAALVGLAVVGATLTAAESDREVVEVMKKSFKARGQAQLDRLDQDEMQAACSRSVKQGPLPGVDVDRLQRANLAAIRYPADGRFMGDWKEGEKIAQSGVGKQFSDDPKRPSGANCYACHQLSPRELSFGTIGPSLYNYGKLRGASPEVQKYTFIKVYNSQALKACSSMPRFGHNGILTDEQIKHVVALLLDPDSPVNK